MTRAKLDGVKGSIRAAEAIMEVALLTVCYYLFWRHGYSEGVFPYYYGNGKFVLMGVYALLTVVLFHNFEGFRFGYLRLADVLVSQGIAVVIVNFVTYWQLCLIANQIVSAVPLLVLSVADMAIVFVCGSFYTWLYHRLYTPKNMVMVFGTAGAIRLKFKMETRTDKYHISKLLPASLGFEAICAELPKYDAVIINDVPAQLRNDILKFCYQNGLRTYLAPKLTDIIHKGAEDITLFDTPLLLVRSQGLNAMQRLVKRAMDIVLCSLALVVTAPIMLIVAIAIKLEDGGPVFFKQERVTRNSKTFQILKFRSMIVDAEKDGKSRPATDGDPRITKVGKFIRASRLDELPQILNILKGDMSIVGPRPERVEHVEKYKKEIPEFDFRLKVKGGLTGYAQIFGKYNTTPYDKLRLDLMYIENYSVMLDIKLILMTLRILLKKESTEGFLSEQEEARLQEEMEKAAIQENDSRE